MQKVGGRIDRPGVCPVYFADGYQEQGPDLQLKDTGCLSQSFTGEWGKLPGKPNRQILRKKTRTKGTCGIYKDKRHRAEVYTVEVSSGLHPSGPGTR